MKINNYIKKSLSVLILLFVFLNTPVKTYATVFEISNIKRNIFNVSFTTNPVAINGTITVCQGQTITYTNTSTNVGTNPTYLWSFQGGNSTSETTEGPHSITYNTAGNYTTTLTINGSSSNVNVIVQNSTSTTPIIEVTTGVG